MTPTCTANPQTPTPALNACKLLVIAAVIAAGLGRADPANLAPFAPRGAAGVLEAASFVFVSVSGFDVVANMAEEVRGRRAGSGSGPASRACDEPRAAGAALGALSRLFWAAVAAISVPQLY
jgi:amino acid transporter